LAGLIFKTGKDLQTTPKTFKHHNMASPPPPDSHRTWSGCTSGSDDTVVDNDTMSEQVASKNVDLEAQPVVRASRENLPPLAMEYRVSARKKLLYLSGYFLLNLSLTLYNKALLGNVSSIVIHSRNES
jgi:hypothetical protein